MIVRFETIKTTIKYLGYDLFRSMNDEFESEGTRYNYASTLDKFYEYLEMIGEVDSNPVESVLPRMG